MHHVIAVPLLLLLGGVLEAGALHKAAKIVNLTEEARKYVGRVNTTALGTIDSWGLTKEYDYWTQQHKRGHPIKATVKRLSCVPGYKLDKPLRMSQDYKCESELSLFIDKGMLSPFNLSATVKFPLIPSTHAEKTTVVTLDLNGKMEDHKTIEKKSGNSEIRGCNFFAEVIFNGSFAYHSKKGRYYRVPVQYLKKYDEKLYARGHKLVYNITGAYTQKICF
uniref:Immunosuppressant protein p36 n=1 Tax=Dermacentor andersoni TaxID=34620 RepID=Q9U6Z4_DERAN|nr:immunosuppressant protein p36 [Dermacentor andersoni]